MIKTGLFILVFLCSNILISQKKICEEKSVMYSKCYTLNTDKTFQYRANYCGQLEIGKGFYKEFNNKIIFEFDSIVPTKIEKKQIENEKKVSITIISISNNEPIPYLEVIYKGNIMTTDEKGKVYLDYTDEEIKIFSYFRAQSIEINPKLDNSNNYILYVTFNGEMYIEKGRIVKLKKVGEKFKLKEKLKKYNEKRAKYIEYKKSFYYIFK